MTTCYFYYHDYIFVSNTCWRIVTVEQSIRTSVIKQIFGHDAPVSASYHTITSCKLRHIISQFVTLVLFRAIASLHWWHITHDYLHTWKLCLSHDKNVLVSSVNNFHIRNHTYCLIITHPRLLIIFVLIASNHQWTLSCVL